MEVRHGQSLLDIAIQETGSAEEALTIALMNGKCLTEALGSGEQIEVPDDEEGNRDTHEFYRKRHILPATASTKEEEALSPYGGIAYMGIGIDFIVS